MCFRMDNDNELIRNLSERSGKSRKFEVVALETTSHNNQLFFVVFLASIVSKFCIVMRNTEKESHGIRASRSYFVKNIQHVTSIENIPIFKLTNTSVLRLSQRPDVNVQTFSESEISSIMSDVVVDNFIENNDVPLNFPNLQQPQQNDGNVVSLHTFCFNPASFQGDQYVEVFRFCH